MQTERVERDGQPDAWLLAWGHAADADGALALVRKAMAYEPGDGFRLHTVVVGTPGTAGALMRHPDAHRIAVEAYYRGPLEAEGRGGP